MSTKKLRIALIALAAVLAVSIGGYVLVDQMKKHEEQAAREEQASLVLASFDANSVDTVEITNADGYFRIAADETGSWTVAETDYPHPFALNAYYINVINNYMSSLTATQKVDADPAQRASYGLDAPTTIVCHTGAQSYTVEIGTGSVTNEFYYAALPGSDTVYCIAYDTGEILRGGIGYLRESYMLNFSETQINTFKLERSGEIAYDLRMDDAGQWQLHAPVTDIPINTVKVSTALTDLVRVEYQRFITVTEDRQELAQYGLDAPAYEMTIGTEDSEIVLQFSAFDADTSEYYVYDTATHGVATVSTDVSGVLDGKWQGLLNDQVLRVPFADAKSLDVTVDGKHFTLTMEDGTYRLDDIDISALDDNTRSNFEYLYASVAEIKYDSVDESPNAPENPAPTCTFVYTLKDGTTRTLDLAPIDDTTYWAYVDHRCIGQIVRRNALSGTTGVLNFLEKITDALADQGIDYAPADAESPAETDAQTSGETTEETTPDNVPTDAA